MLRIFGTILIVAAMGAGGCRQSASADDRSDAALPPGEDGGELPVEPVVEPSIAEEGDDDLVAGESSEIVTGVNLIELTYANARARCDYQEITPTTYKVHCAAVASQPGGEELRPQVVADGVTLDWAKPRTVHGEVSAVSCLVGGSGLTQVCELTAPTRQAKIQIDLQVDDSISNARKSEKSFVTLPVSVQVAAGFVPTIPIKYAQASLESGAGLVAASEQIGFQNTPFTAEIAQLKMTYVCMRGKRLFFSAGNRVYEFSEGEIRNYAGSILTEKNANHRLRLDLYGKLPLACTDDAVYVGSRNRVLRLKDSGAVEHVVGADDKGGESDFDFLSDLSVSKNGVVYFSASVMGQVDKQTLRAVSGGKMSTMFGADNDFGIIEVAAVAAGNDDEVFIVDKLRDCVVRFSAGKSTHVTKCNNRSTISGPPQVGEMAAQVQMDPRDVLVRGDGALVIVNPDGSLVDVDAAGKITATSKARVDMSTLKNTLGLGGYVDIAKTDDGGFLLVEASDAGNVVFKFDQSGKATPLIRQAAPVDDYDKLPTEQSTLQLDFLDIDGSGQIYFTKDRRIYTIVDGHYRKLYDGEGVFSNQSTGSGEQITSFVVSKTGELFISTKIWIDGLPVSKVFKVANGVRILVAGAGETAGPSGTDGQKLAFELAEIRAVDDEGRIYLQALKYNGQLIELIRIDREGGVSVLHTGDRLYSSIFLKPGGGGLAADSLGVYDLDSKWNATTIAGGGSEPLNEAQLPAKANSLSIGTGKVTYVSDDSIYLVQYRYNYIYELRKDTDGEWVIDYWFGTSDSQQECGVGKLEQQSQASDVKNTLHMSINKICRGGQVDIVGFDSCNAGQGRANIVFAQSFNSYYNIVSTSRPCYP